MDFGETNSVHNRQRKGKERRNRGHTRAPSLKGMTTTLLLSLMAGTSHGHHPAKNSITAKRGEQIPGDSYSFRFVLILLGISAASDILSVTVLLATSKGKHKSKLLKTVFYLI